MVLVFLLAAASSMLRAAIQVPEDGIPGTAVGDSLSAAQDQPQASREVAAGPQIEFTSVPAYGSSDLLLDHFYTINEAEKDKRISQQKDTWMYEGIVFYVWPEGRQPPGTCPVHRFRSAETGSHFYTASESEKDKLVKDYQQFWTYEGVAWHAYCLRAE